MSYRRRSPSASSGSLGKNLVEQKFLDPDLLAAAGYPTGAYPPGTRFVQQVFASPMGTVKRNLVPVFWKQSYGSMHTEPYGLQQVPPTFFEERIRTLPSGQTIRSLVPFEGKVVYGEELDFPGLSDIAVDPENPVTSRLAWAQAQSRKPFPVGIFPFRYENKENVLNRSLVPTGIGAEPQRAFSLRAPSGLSDPGSPFLLRSLSAASDPHSLALSRSTTEMNSPRPVLSRNNITRNLSRRTHFPGTYVLVRRNNVSRKNRRSSPPRGPYNARGSVMGSETGYAVL